jgi:hypothetical protein
MMTEANEMKVRLQQALSTVEVAKAALLNYQSAMDEAEAIILQVGMDTDSGLHSRSGRMAPALARNHMEMKSMITRVDKFINGLEDWIFSL